MFSHRAFGFIRVDLSIWLEYLTLGIVKEKGRIMHFFEALSHGEFPMRMGKKVEKADLWVFLFVRYAGGNDVEYVYYAVAVKVAVRIVQRVRWWTYF
jgi:hypothetical protein